MKKSNDYLDVPKFSFGTKAVIRPLPTSQKFNTPLIKTLAELKAYVQSKNKS